MKCTLFLPAILMISCAGFLGPEEPEPTCTESSTRIFALLSDLSSRLYAVQRDGCGAVGSEMDAWVDKHGRAMSRAYRRFVTCDHKRSENWSFEERNAELGPQWRVHSMFWRCQNHTGVLRAFNRVLDTVGQDLPYLDTEVAEVDAMVAECVAIGEQTHTCRNDYAAMIADTVMEVALPEAGPEEKAQQSAHLASQIARSMDPAPPEPERIETCREKVAALANEGMVHEYLDTHQECRVRPDCKGFAACLKPLHEDSIRSSVRKVEIRMPPDEETAEPQPEEAEPVEPAEPASKELPQPR